MEEYSANFCVDSMINEFSSINLCVGRWICVGNDGDPHGESFEWDFVDDYGICLDSFGDLSMF